MGLDENIKEVVGQLVNEDKQCQVMSICGMGGLGRPLLLRKLTITAMLSVILMVSLGLIYPSNAKQGMCGKEY